MTGYIHSIETCGTLDGPGLRYVAFLQGCPLRCKFCHNPDSWQVRTGQEYSVDELMEDILRYKSFIRSGGVTLSGGEPLFQAEFAAELFRQCKLHGIHTAVDTSGAIPLQFCRAAIDEVDLVLLDIKHLDTDKCRELTGKGNEGALELLDYCEKIGKPVWIRHVVVPGFTDDLAEIEKMAEYLSRYTVIQRVEILPFHKMGEYKWKELGLKYELDKTPVPARELIENIKDIFTRKKLVVG